MNALGYFTIYALCFAWGCFSPNVPVAIAGALVISIGGFYILDNRS